MTFQDPRRGHIYLSRACAQRKGLGNETTMYSSVPPPGHVEEPTPATVPETSENKPRHVHDHQWKVNIVGSTARECIIYYTVTIQTIVMLVFNMAVCTVISNLRSW